VKIYEYTKWSMIAHVVKEVADEEEQETKQYIRKK
jgi:hypothetical protein